MPEEEIDPGLARLVAAHPQIFRGTPPAIFSYLMPGWYDIVDKLCSDIEAVLGTQNLKRFQCLQIKEKFGTLRFYWRYKAAGRPRVDAMSADRFMSFEAPPNKTAKLGQTLQVLVEAACDASETVCETCGQPGKLLCTNSLLMTRCQAHAEVHVD